MQIDKDYLHVQHVHPVVILQSWVHIIVQYVAKENIKAQLDNLSVIYAVLVSMLKIISHLYVLLVLLVLILQMLVHICVLHVAKESTKVQLDNQSVSVVLPALILIKLDLHLV